MMLFLDQTNPDVGSMIAAFAPSLFACADSGFTCHRTSSTVIWQALLLAEFRECWIGVALCKSVSKACQSQADCIRTDFAAHDADLIPVREKLSKTRIAAVTVFRIHFPTNKANTIACANADITK